MPERGIREGNYRVIPREATEVPIYYDADGNYTGSLPTTYRGNPIGAITGPNGNRSVVTFHHVYDHNLANRSPITSYEGLMTSTAMVTNLTLQVFADIPSQSSQSNAVSSSAAVILNAEKNTGVSSAASRSQAPVAPVQDKQGQVKQSVSNSQGQVNAASSVSHLQTAKHQQLPATGDQQNHGLVILGVLAGLAGLGMAWRIKKRDDR